jgi:hypothetical protein
LSRLVCSLSSYFYLEDMELQTPTTTSEQTWLLLDVHTLLLLFIQQTLWTLYSTDRRHMLKIIHHQTVWDKRKERKIKQEQRVKYSFFPGL